MRVFMRGRVIARLRVHIEQTHGMRGVQLLEDDADHRMPVDVRIIRDQTNVHRPTCSLCVRSYRVTVMMAFRPRLTLARSARRRI